MLKKKDLKKGNLYTIKFPNTFYSFGNRPMGRFPYCIYSLKDSPESIWIEYEENECYFIFLDKSTSGVYKEDCSIFYWVSKNMVIKCYDGHVFTHMEQVV